MFKGRVLLVLGAVNGIESLEMLILIFYRAGRSQQLLRQRDKVLMPKMLVCLAVVYILSLTLSRNFFSQFSDNNQ